MIHARIDETARAIGAGSTRRRLLAAAPGALLGLAGRRPALAHAQQPATPLAKERCVPGTVISLGVGQAYTIDPEGIEPLTVRFAGVEDDSRCPYSIGAVCVWEGQATIVVELTDDVGREVRVPWLSSDAFRIVWSPLGQQVLVAAVGLSGDSATSRADLVLDLLIVAGWLKPA